MYLLASPDAPQGAADEALRLAEDGKKVTHAMAQKLIEAEKAKEKAELENAMPLPPFQTEAFRGLRPGAPMQFTAISLYVLHGGERQISPTNWTRRSKATKLEEVREGQREVPFTFLQ